MDPGHIDFAQPLRYAGGHPVNVLFLEKVFLRKRKNIPLRGVELFNVYLIRDLLQNGIRVTLLAHRSWQAALQLALPDALPEFVWTGGSGLDFMDAIAGIARLGRRPFDTLLMANVGNSLIPALRLLRWRRNFNHCILIAHREASPRFVRTLMGTPGHVLAVNCIIAEPFRKAGFPSVHIDYGIMNADRFSPDEMNRPHERIRFCVLGVLDNAWKGADTAVDAFRGLPGEVRGRAELHLYSFTTPPAYPEENIHAHGWTDPREIPDLLRSMDVMLVPSRDEGVMRETFSQAVVQGMLTGLPIIASDRPVLAEKLDAGGGLIFHNREELINAMAQLALDKDVRKKLGAEARRTALARYVWNTSTFIDTYLRPATIQ